MNKFKIATLGCKVNQYDSLALKRKLMSAGLVYDEKSPNLVIVNTCAVTKTAIRKDKRMLNGLRKDHPKAKFVFMGCFPQTYKGEIEKSSADIVWGTGQLDELCGKVVEMMGVDDCYVCSADLGEREYSPPGQGERSRYFLKIQDGCQQFCSYCNIPYARGDLRSRARNEVLEEIKNAISVGYEEIVLCGIHLGLYGKERDSTTCDLATLLSEIIEIEGLGRIRLSSIEANDVSNNLLDVMSEGNKIARHLHLPLQAGSDKILKKMNRPYDKKVFEKVVVKARKLMPDIAISTDVMVGFPGETEDDFFESVSFCKKNKFSKIHVFPFSAHEKTPASKMNDQVSQEIKKERAGKLRKVGDRLQQEFANEFKGKEVDIVIETIEDGFVSGKAGCYLDVRSPIDEIDIKKPVSKNDIGKIVKVKI